MMKKLLTIAILAAAVMTSCIKSEKEDPGANAIRNGLEFYNTGSANYTITTMPAAIAVRMNTLMVEALRINGDRNPSVAVQETVGGTTTNYKSNLFSNATITVQDFDTPDEVITIVYPEAYYYEASKDNAYWGTVTIKTGGNLLSDFDNEEFIQWTLNSSNLLLVGRYDNTHMEWDADDYTISIDYPGTWRVGTDSYRHFVTNTQTKAEWSTSYTISLSSASTANASYANMSKQPITVSDVYSHGNIIDSDLTMSYSLDSPMTYQPKCSQSTVSSGKEIISSPALSAYAPNTFPYPSVSVTWGWANETSCSTSATLVYGEYSKVFYN